MSAIKHLSNDLFIDSYFKAKSFNLESDFIYFLLNEITTRRIESRIN
nr:sporulation histidine kinase inhibitor Sda [Virgibacillus salinus]